MAAQRAEYDAKRIERDRRMAAVRSNKLSELERELEYLFVTSEESRRSQKFQVRLFEYLTVFATVQGTAEGSREWALDLYTALLHGWDISFVPRLNKTTKPRKTIYDYKGERRDGTQAPFIHYLHALIKGKTQNRNEAQRRHNQRHLQIRENPAELGPGMITIDHAIELHGIISDDAVSLPPLWRLVQDVRDSKLQGQLRDFASSAVYGGTLGNLRLSAAEKKVFHLFLIDGEGNQSQIERETGIDRRRVKFLLDKYLVLKLAITRSRVLEKGMEDSMKSIQHLLGWRNLTDENRDSEEHNEEGSECDPENPAYESGWVAHWPTTGQYDEMAPNPDWRGPMD